MVHFAFIKELLVPLPLCLALPCLEAPETLLVIRPIHLPMPAPSPPSPLIYLCYYNPPLLPLTASPG